MSIGGETVIIDNSNYQMQYIESINLSVPTIGKLFFERKRKFQFCKPELIPLRSQGLERLEEMKSKTCYQFFQKRTNDCSKFHVDA